MKTLKIFIRVEFIFIYMHILHNYEKTYITFASCEPVK